MTRRPRTALYFTTVTAIAEGRACLGGYLYLEGTEPTVTRLMIAGPKGWGHLGDLPDVAYATTTRPDARPGMPAMICVLGRRGCYREYARAVPPVESKVPVRVGYLHDLRRVGDALVACGTQQQVVRRVKGRWKAIDKGAYTPMRDTVTGIFHAIDGFDPDDLYAVALSGEVWHWDGARWRGERVSELSLYSVLCTSWGEVYAAGSGGAIFRLRPGGDWTSLGDPSATKSVIEDLAEFRGRVWAAATDALVAVAEGGRLERVVVPVKGATAFQAVDADDEKLWTVGDECVLEHDGQTWTRHVCPDNVTRRKS